MTLAVAACWPWKRLRSAFPLSPFEQAVILSTDSRVTAPPKSPKDNSAKAYWLARYCGLVYAGDVAAAEAAIKPLRSYLRRLPARMIRDPFQELTVIIREAYAGEQERVRKGDRLPLGVLDVLVGICDREGRAWALKMSSHGEPDDAGTRHLAKDPFEQIAGVGAQAIGESRAVRTFHETLADVEAKRFESNTLDPNPINWSADVVIAIQTAIEQAGPRGLVGGGIQTLIITKDDIGEKHWSRRPLGPADFDPVKYGPPPMNPTDPMHAHIWEQLTVPLKTVGPYRSPTRHSPK